MILLRRPVDVFHYFVTSLPWPLGMPFTCWYQDHYIHTENTFCEILNKDDGYYLLIELICVNVLM